MRQIDLKRLPREYKNFLYEKKKESPKPKLVEEGDKEISAMVRRDSAIQQSYSALVSGRRVDKELQKQWGEAQADLEEKVKDVEYWQEVIDTHGGPLTSKRDLAINSELERQLGAKRGPRQKVDKFADAQEGRNLSNVISRLASQAAILTKTSRQSKAKIKTIDENGKIVWRKDSEWQEDYETHMKRLVSMLGEIEEARRSGLIAGISTQFRNPEEAGGRKFDEQGNKIFDPGDHFMQVYYAALMSSAKGMGRQLKYPEVDIQSTDNALIDSIQDVPQKERLRNLVGGTLPSHHALNKNAIQDLAGQLSGLRWTESQIRLMEIQHPNLPKYRTYQEYLEANKEFDPTPGLHPETTRNLSVREIIERLSADTSWQSGNHLSPEQKQFLHGAIGEWGRRVAKGDQKIQRLKGYQTDTLRFYASMIGIGGKAMNRSGGNDPSTPFMFFGTEGIKYKPFIQDRAEGPGDGGIEGSDTPLGGFGTGNAGGTGTSGTAATPTPPTRDWLKDLRAIKAEKNKLDRHMEGLYTGFQRVERCREREAGIKSGHCWNPENLLLQRM